VLAVTRSSHYGHEIMHALIGGHAPARIPVAHAQSLKQVTAVRAVRAVRVQVFIFFFVRFFVDRWVCPKKASARKTE
jgi:hypothetical protein